jgi:hypothetical protein
MTTMASITHCLKRTLLDLMGMLACASLFWALAGSVHAEMAKTEVSALRFERSAEDLLLSASVKFDLPPVVEEALLKGVALNFVAEVDVLRERWYWMNQRVLTAERHMRLAFHPLTRRWRVNVSSGQIPSGGLGLALSQNFETMAEALSVVQRLSRWKIGDTAELDLDPRYLVDFRFRLDMSQLPRPLQIGTLGQVDWDIAVTTRRPLVWEANK